jgi:two-component system NtrC family response regulator
MPHAEETSPSPVGPLILVVDDELTPRSIVCRMARALGYEVLSFRSGHDVLRWLRENDGEARLLLVDLEMPRMDGGELAERVIDLDPRLHVVLLVPDDAHDLLAGYLDLPALRKPVSFDAIADMLENLLGRPARSAPYPPTMGPPRWRASGQQRPKVS